MRRATFQRPHRLRRRCGGIVPAASMLLALTGLAWCSVCEEQRQALLRLYDTTGGHGWSSWSGKVVGWRREGPADPCKWTGVTCGTDAYTLGNLLLSTSRNEVVRLSHVQSRCVVALDRNGERHVRIGLLTMARTVRAWDVCAMDGVW